MQVVQRFGDDEAQEQQEQENPTADQAQIDNQEQAQGGAEGHAADDLAAGI
jgi:hypothetical protein